MNHAPAGPRTRRRSQPVVPGEVASRRGPVIRPIRKLISFQPQMIRPPSSYSIFWASWTSWLRLASSSSPNAAWTSCWYFGSFQWVSLYGAVGMDPA